jgi:hypothetical protein
MGGPHSVVDFSYWLAFDSSPEMLYDDFAQKVVKGKG